LESTAITQDDIDELGLPGDLALPPEEDAVDFGFGGGGFFAPEHPAGFGGGGGGFFNPEDTDGLGGFFSKGPGDGEPRSAGFGRGEGGADVSGNGVVVNREYRAFQNPM
jgi:hypothetical protein